MSRVLICVFDALRPEFVTPELMPSLYGFAAEGVQYLNSRSTFPTETRVNQSAVTTGCLPRKHGIVGNKMIAQDLLGGRMINTGDDAALREAQSAGPVLHMPNLAERLATAGRSFASLSAGTPGGGRLINHSAEKIGSTRLAMKAPDKCWPVDLYQKAVERIGPLPDPTPPAPDWIDWAVATYRDVIDTDVTPDVMLLWLCEPDETFHWHGIGGPESEGIMHHVDEAFGRILDRHADVIAAGDMHVIAMSDHGQLSLTGPRLDIAGKLTDAGFSCGRDGLDEVDCAIALANGGGIWVRDPELIAPIVAWLLAQDWCGPVFTRDGIAGTLRQDLLGLDHARAPDIALVCASSATQNVHGVTGESLHDAPYPQGGGCHGGLSPWELHNVLCLGGAQVRTGTQIEAPAGNIDVLPTVMQLLGLPVPGDVDGRALTEALRDGPSPDSVAWEAKTNTAEGAVLESKHLGAGLYLDRAWRP